MSLTTGDKVLGIRLGIDKGLPVYGTIDPCESPASSKALTVLMGIDNGLPIHGTAEIKATADLVNTAKVLAVMMGVDGGLPVYGIPTYQCLEDGGGGGPLPCGVENLFVCIFAQGCENCQENVNGRFPLPNAEITIRFGRWQSGFPLDEANFNDLGTCNTTITTGPTGCFCLDLNVAGCGPGRVGVDGGINYIYGYLVTGTHPRNGTAFPVVLYPGCGALDSCNDESFLASVFLEFRNANYPNYPCDPDVNAEPFHCGACAEKFPETIFWQNEFGIVTMKRKQWDSEAEGCTPLGVMDGECKWIGTQTIQKQRYTATRWCFSQDCIGCEPLEHGDVQIKWIYPIPRTGLPVCDVPLQGGTGCGIGGYAKFVAHHSRCYTYEPGEPIPPADLCWYFYDGPTPTNRCDEISECPNCWTPFIWFRIIGTPETCDPMFSITADCKALVRPYTDCPYHDISGGILSE